MSRRERRGAGAGRGALWAVALAAGALASGCWETPSRGWYDGGVDGGRPDGRCDAGCCGAECCDGSDCAVPEMGVQPRERDCDDGDDNDEDGLEDCVDNDCSSAASCCQDGTNLITEYWTSDLWRWDHLTSVQPATPPMREVDEYGGQALTGWDDSTPHVLMRDSCSALALGAVFTFDVIATAPTSACSEDDETGHIPCDRYAAVMLSSVRDTTLGQPLFEDLAIRVHGDVRGLANTDTPVIYNHAMVRVTQGGQEIGRLLIEPGVRYAARLSVSPSVHGGAASLRADLELRPVNDDAAQAMEVRNIFIRRQDALIEGVTGCMDVGGLYVAVEMVGDGARLGPLVARTLQCANPSHFQPPSLGTATLTSDSLGVPDSYGGAHVGSPSLGSSFNSASDTSRRWDLFFDATNDPPELEDNLGVRVGYAIAHARTATFGAMPGDWTTGGTPRLGADPPSCLLSGGTCSEPSVREPFLLVRRDADDLLQEFTVAFASEHAEAGHELRVVAGVNFSPNVPVGGASQLLLSPADTGCVDLRDPALVPVQGGSGGYWLLFTCVPSSSVSEIRAARLDDDFALLTDPPIQRVVAPAMFGALAAGGVSAAEPIVQTSATGLTLHLWMVASDAAGDTSIVLATGKLRAAEVMALETLPPLEPYLANPVLRSDAAVLGGCAGFCVITGLAVSDTAGELGELRFVVARRVVTNTTDQSELVWLTQTWRAP